MLTGFGRRLAATLLYCLVISLISLGDAQAETNNLQSSLPDDWDTRYKHNKLEFIAGPGCVSMPAGVSKLYFNAGNLKNASAANASDLLDSAVVDGVVVTEMSSPCLNGVAFSPDFSAVLTSYEIDYVARNVPPSVPGETFDVINDGIPVTYDLSVFYRLHFSDTLDASVVKAALEAVPCVDSVGYWPVIEYCVDTVNEPFRGPFRDELSDSQWHLKAPSPERPGGIDVEGAWRIVWDSLVSPTAPEVLIAIPDESFGTKLHVDLVPNIHEASRIAFSDLPWGPHGTWVAGVTSAAAGNGWPRNQDRNRDGGSLGVGTRGLGVVGIAPTAKALLVNNTGASVEEGLEAGLEELSYIVYYPGHEVDVINCSWVVSGSPTLRALTEVAFFEKNIVVVAGSGNFVWGDPWHSLPFVAYPANYSHVISVGANTMLAVVADFSNRGNINVHMKVDMIAPGEDILTTGSQIPKDPPPPESFDENGWYYRSGTSFSAPMVTGVVALMKVANPELSAATIYDILKESCHQPAGYTAYNQTTGHGIIDARLAVQRAKDLTRAVCDSTPGDVNADCHVNYGDIKYLIDYLYAGGLAPEYPDNADVNGDCELTIADVSYLIDYVFLGGEPPLPGCSAGSAHGDNQTAELPDRVALGNYPNPFNPATTIRYSLPQQARVTIDVFNLLGERIVTLVDQVQQAGEHVALWDGSNESREEVASGVYFYRLTAGEDVISKKMLLLK